MVLHTDDDHPHVHVVVKAVGEEGERLNIRKETLRRWRAVFAQQLRAQGVNANATERAVRGAPLKAYKDGIYRAAQRHASTHVIAGERDAVERKAEDGAHVGAGAVRLRVTNKAVRDGFFALASQLARQGEHDLSRAASRFAKELPRAPTEQERIRAHLTLPR
jgi:hypothetical protein